MRARVKSASQIVVFEEAVLHIGAHPVAEVVQIIRFLEIARTISGRGLLVGEDCDKKLAWIECLQHAPDYLVVGRLGDVALERDVRELGLRCYVDRHVFVLLEEQSEI